MTQNDLSTIIDGLASRLDRLDKDSPEYRVLLSEMDYLAARLARETQQDKIDEQAEAYFDNMPV